MNSVCLKHGRPQTLPSPSRFLLPLQLHVNVPIELSVCFVPVAQVLHAHDLLPQSVHQLLVTAVGNAGVSVCASAVIVLVFIAMQCMVNGTLRRQLRRCLPVSVCHNG